MLQYVHHDQCVYSSRDQESGLEIKWRSPQHLKHETIDMNPT